jgi:hypothetical protein
MERTEFAALLTGTQAFPSSALVEQINIQGIHKNKANDRPSCIDFDGFHATRKPQPITPQLRIHGIAHRMATTNPTHPMRTQRLLQGFSNHT